MSLDVDLVITFTTSKRQSISKQQTRQDAEKAEQQYSRLLETLSYAGLRAVGRRGESLGHLLVFVKCPDNLLQNLVKRERQSDFLSGLPTTPLSAETVVLLAPADRIRLVHSYITSIPSDGGLGITPGSSEWDLVESVMCLHDRHFNEQWIHAWTRQKLGLVTVEKIRDQFGDSVALYFTFLQSYANALLFPSVLGVIFYFFGKSYSPIYSSLLLLWSTVFVEWWRVHERLLSLRFGTRGSFRVEKRRAQYTPGFDWWKRELRMVVSLPVIVLFACVLVTILTGIFMFEAFVAHLYTGPGHRFLGFAPTVLFAVLVPRFLAVYKTSVRRFTEWENHAHQSSHVASLTLKTFALSALVAYLGLALSAFVYVPFGEGVMRLVQSWFSTPGPEGETIGLWEADISKAGAKLNPGRLRDQMFAYTVTNQVVNTFLEIGLPFFLRGFDKFRKGKAKETEKKKVVFEDEKEKGGLEERRFLETVRKQAALPEYDLFVDYDEMVTQFGYIVLWSAIWPLAPVMALVNNYVEIRSDAFKITVHTRRPIPSRTDTIGPWLDALTFLTWLGALTNSALVYLFCPRAKCGNGTPLERFHQQLFNSTISATKDGSVDVSQIHLDGASDLILRALLIAAAASHGYIFVRLVVRHIMERMFWKGSDEVKEREREEREIKQSFLKGEVVRDVVPESARKGPPAPAVGESGIKEFWEHDEGVEEIRRISKEA